MKAETIKLLQYEKENGYLFKEVDKESLLKELLAHIGDLDSLNRDKLVYPNLAHLLHDNHFEKEKLIEVTKLLISDKFLTYDMSNLEEYSVLKRSFTLLQLAILVYVHNRDDIFDVELIQNIIENFYSYFKNETVLTGYEREVGWMHSIAHSADLFAQIFKCKELKEEDAKRALLLVRDKFMISSYNYVSDEDERMVTAIKNLLNRNLLSREFLLEWIEGFTSYEPPKEYPKVYTFKNNRKNLLRSLYFRIMSIKDLQYLLSPLKTRIIENEGIR
jgi:hypothetical protein